MEDTLPDTADPKFFLNQVDDLYGNLGYTNAAVILISTFLAWILWPVSHDHGLVLWYTCVILLNLWSILLSQWYKRAGVNENNARAWLNTYLVSVFLSGVVWGSLLLYVVPYTATIHLLVAVFMLAGLVTGSAATLSSLKYGFGVFSIPAILPSAILLIYINRPVTFIIGCSLIAFLVFVIFLALRIHRTLFYSLRKQMEVSNKLSEIELEKIELQIKVDALRTELEESRAEAQLLKTTLKHKAQPVASLRRASDLRDHRFASLLDDLMGGVWDMNLRTGELVFSKGWLHMMGYDGDDNRMRIEVWENALHPDDRLTVLNKLHAFADGSVPVFSSSHRLRSRKGEWIWVMARAHGVIWGSFGELLNIVGMELHVPETGDAAGRSLDLLNFDINSWLVAQEDFDKRFAQLVSTASIEGIEHTLCHIRIVHMHDQQEDSESLDEVRLYELGRVLLNDFRHGDALLRQGKDSFMLLLAFCKPEDAWDKALTLQRSLRNLQVNFKGEPLKLTVGVGITPITANARSRDDILQDARTACDRAIANTSNLIYVYQRDNQQLGSNFFERYLVQKVREGIRHDRIQLTALPLLPLLPLAHEPDANAEQMLAVDVNPGSDGRDQFAGADFRSVIHDNRLGASLDSYVINKLPAFSATNRGSYSGHSVYFYECTAAACLDAAFLELVLQQLARLPAQQATLCLGVPEAAWNEHTVAITRFMEAVRNAGGRIALTRFGSSAVINSLIRECPLDYLKLDASLLHNLGEDKSSSITVKYINDMIHLAGMKSIVDDLTPALLPATLQSMNIDFMQTQQHQHAAELLALKSAG